MNTCSNCKEECKMIEETHDAPATHCNYGIASIHKTGIYLSDCCMSAAIMKCADCENDLTWADDSFDHEFGTEKCGHWECDHCDELKEMIEGNNP